jgi:hypothetical protein
MSDDEQSANDDFEWTELKPERQLTRNGNPELGFRLFLCMAKSDTEQGRALHNDPIAFLRENADMGIGDDDVRAMVLRVNAERSANPRHRAEVWMVIPGSTTAVGLQYKYPNVESEPE